MADIDTINNPEHNRSVEVHGPRERALLDVEDVAAMMRKLIAGKHPMPKVLGCAQGQAVAVVVSEIWKAQGGHIHCIIHEDNAPELVLTEGPPPEKGKSILTGSGYAFIY